MRSGPDGAPHALRVLFSRAGSGGRLIVAGYAIILVDAVAQSLTPAVFRVVLNRIEQDPQRFLHSGWQGPVLGAAGLAATFLAAAYFAHTWTRRGAARWANNLRRTLYEHVQRLSIDFFHRSHVGDVTALINQDVERLELTVWQGLALWWAVALLVISVGLIAWVDAWLALIAIGLLAVAVGWTLLVLPRLRRHSRGVQDPVLLSGSLARNLRLARPTATDDELETALKAANAWEFVRTWDSGIHTETGERGVTLSGGQRQRLAIARLMLRDPAIVILDEATSALDAASERLVLGAFDRLLAGRTSLVIAHRIATVRDCDQIVVVEHGRVGDIGTHASLLQTSQTYRSYCHEQAVA